MWQAVLNAKILLVKAQQKLRNKMWTEITNQSDIEQLLESYGFFHDSCLRDVYISTREYIDTKLAMHFDNKIIATLFFQRQSKPTTIELKFVEVERFNFVPFDESESAVIYDATLRIENGLYYWADFAGWQTGDNDSIWICSKKLFWRQRPGLLGNVNRLTEN